MGQSSLALRNHSQILHPPHELQVLDVLVPHLRLSCFWLVGGVVFYDNTAGSKNRQEQLTPLQPLRSRGKPTLLKRSVARE
jgi:hypothetical protein